MKISAHNICTRKASGFSKGVGVWVHHAPVPHEIECTRGARAYARKDQVRGIYKERKFSSIQREMDADIAVSVFIYTKVISKQSMRRLRNFSCFPISDNGGVNFEDEKQMDVALDTSCVCYTVRVYATIIRTEESTATCQLSKWLISRISRD